MEQRTDQRRPRNPLAADEAPTAELRQPIPYPSLAPKKGLLETGTQVRRACSLQGTGGRLAMVSSIRRGVR